MEPRTTCEECGEELWGVEGRGGVCISCMDRAGAYEELNEYLDDLREEGE